MNGQKYAIPFPIFLAVSVGMIVMALLFYLQFHSNESLPKLPGLSLQSTATDSRSAAPTASSLSESLYYPYYGAPQYNYRYSLKTAFPAIGDTLPVYTVTPISYDRAAAMALAAKLGFTEEPLDQGDSFVFTSGTTPSSTRLDTTTDSSEKTTIEPAEPMPTEPAPDQVIYDGKELTVTTQGYISYTDYALTQAASLSVSSGEGDIKTQAPEGVTDEAQAVAAAVGFLRVIELLPDSYESAVTDPYGTYPVTLTPTRDTYPIQPGAISVQVGAGGVVASLSMRVVTTTIFSPYPLKSQTETLSLGMLEYTVDEVSIRYVSSYAEDGTEYVQPVYVLSGTDSLGNEFSFEIPAVKAEFLQNPTIMPLAEDKPVGL